MNILFISSWFPTRLAPTHGNFIYSHAKSIAILHQVEVVYATKDPELKEKYEYTKENKDGFTTHIVYFKTPNCKIKFINRILLQWRYVKAYKKALSKVSFKADMVHHNIMYPVGLLALWLNFKYKTPFVMSENWSIYQKENRHRIKGFKRWVFRKVSSNASYLLPVSTQLKNVMQETGMKGKYKLVPNTIDVDIFKFQEKQKNSIFKFIHVSTLVDEVKNVSGILRAFKQMLDQDPDNHLQIISDGELKPFIEFANKIGIPKQAIDFVGTQTAKQVANWLHQSNAFVLFSNFENLPLVIIESFSTGTPVIASDVGGIKERFPDGGGIIIPRKDEKQLLEAMINLKANYDNYDKKMISEYANDNFSYHAVGKQFDKIYKEILSQ